MKTITNIYKWCAHPHHLFFITIAALLLPNIALCVTEQLGVAASLANVLLPAGIYWMAMTLSRKPGKPIWGLFLFIFFAAFQIVLLYLFGKGIIAVDMFLNLVTTNPGEAMELLDNLVPGVAFVFIVYLPILILGVVSIRGKKTTTKAFIHNQRIIGGALTAAGLLSLSAAYITDDDYRAELDLYPANIIYNIYLAGERTYQTNHYAETSKGFSFKAKKETAYDGREIYVMVVGETARAYEFSIYGYNRPTTPLMQRERGLVAFSNVMSQSNTTHKSVPMLLSAASATDYDRIYREKGIIEAFKEAGFHTTFISNQLPNHSFIDFFGEEADDWTFIKEHSKEGANTPDEEMLTILNKVLTKNRKRELIVLHCYGSHFNYRERYPRSEAFFRPDDASEAKASNRQQLVNAYDNRGCSCHAIHLRPRREHLRRRPQTVPSRLTHSIILRAARAAHSMGVGELRQVIPGHSRHTRRQPSQAGGKQCVVLPLHARTGRNQHTIPCRLPEYQFRQTAFGPPPLSQRP